MIGPSLMPVFAAHSFSGAAYTLTEFSNFAAQAAFETLQSRRPVTTPAIMLMSDFSTGQLA
jgi:hypothetical protein